MTENSTRKTIQASLRSSYVQGQVAFLRKVSTSCCAVLTNPLDVPNHAKTRPPPSKAVHLYALVSSGAGCWRRGSRLSPGSPWVALRFSSWDSVDNDILIGMFCLGWCPRGRCLPETMLNNELLRVTVGGWDVRQDEQADGPCCRQSRSEQFWPLGLRRCGACWRLDTS